jgi:hypothetical protein
VHTLTLQKYSRLCLSEEQADQAQYNPSALQRLRARSGLLLGEFVQGLGAISGSLNALNGKSRDLLPRWARVCSNDSMRAVSLQFRGLGEWVQDCVALRRRAGLIHNSCGIFPRANRARRLTIIVAT